ncbi:MAG TPA: hypothetical protein VNO19_03665 [Gemmatimonadales bacterium]|nr:hypothetical protein [Gemmatimonadales bacterium]
MTGSDERGIALLIAVVALGVIGALVGGIFFAARLEQQSGQNALYAVQAGEAAEAGLSEAVATLDPAVLELLPVGGTPLDLGTLTLPGGGSASRQASRLTQHLFLIRVRGTSDGAGRVAALRSVGLLVRLQAPADGGADPSGVVRLGERGWVQLY